MEKDEGVVDGLAVEGAEIGGSGEDQLAVFVCGWGRSAISDSRKPSAERCAPRRKENPATDIARDREEFCGVRVGWSFEHSFASP